MRAESRYERSISPPFLFLILPRGPSPWSLSCSLALPFLLVLSSSRSVSKSLSSVWSSLPASGSLRVCSESTSSKSKNKPRPLPYCTAQHLAHIRVSSTVVFISERWLSIRPCCPYFVRGCSAYMVTGVLYCTSLASGCCCCETFLKPNSLAVTDLDLSWLVETSACLEI